MGVPKSCPKCGMIDSPPAQKCDCGWNFSSASAKSNLAPKRPLPWLRIALVMLVGGVALDVVYVLSRRGDEQAKQAALEMQ